METWLTPHIERHEVLNSKFIKLDQLMTGVYIIHIDEFERVVAMGGNKSEFGGSDSNIIDTKPHKLN